MKKLNELKCIEKSRTYYWNDDVIIYLKGITHFKDIKGDHHIKTMDGKYHIVAEGWVHVMIESADVAE